MAFAEMEEGVGGRKVLARSVKMTPVDTLVPHSRNPRRGNVAEIMKSMQHNGFYGTIVAQKGTGAILVGNHRYMAAVKLGYTEVPVMFVDVDDAKAASIMLADNRTNDFADYDDESLKTLLQDLFEAVGTLDGTGYSDADMAAIANDALESVLPVPVPSTSPREVVEGYSFTGSPMGAHEQRNPEKYAVVVPPSVQARVAAGTQQEPVGEEVEDDYEDEEEDTRDVPDGSKESLFDIVAANNELVPSFLPGGISDILYATDNDYGIPALLPELQAQGISLPVITWGVMHKPRSIGTALFYTDERRFKGLWNKPYLLLEKQPGAIAEMNWSIISEYPVAFGLWMIYKKRWFARYCQSLGFRILVDLHVAPKFKKLNFLGVPPGWKAFATRGYSSDVATVKEDLDMARAWCNNDPNMVFLVYGGGKAIAEFCVENNLPHIPDAVAVVRGEVEPYGNDYSWKRDPGSWDKPQEVEKVETPTPVEQETPTPAAPKPKGRKKRAVEGDL